MKQAVCCWTFFPPPVQHSTHANGAYFQTHFFSLPQNSARVVYRHLAAETCTCTALSVQPPNLEFIRLKSFLERTMAYKTSLKKKKPTVCPTVIDNILNDIMPMSYFIFVAWQLYGSLLCFLGSTLSQSCHAVVALLYPFTWQHTYIPVLPPSMLDIVCTPTPFIVGLLSSSLPRLKELPIEEVRTEEKDFVCLFSPLSIQEMP